MVQPRTIYFVYDADGGILGKVKYWINKNILKTGSACELCDITHGTFFVRDAWLKFVAELEHKYKVEVLHRNCLLYTSPSPRDRLLSRMPSSA